MIWDVTGIVFYVHWSHESKDQFYDKLEFPKQDKKIHETYDQKA